jgi:hypothetical protein
VEVTEVRAESVTLTETKARPFAPHPRHPPRHLRSMTLDASSMGTKAILHTRVLDEVNNFRLSFVSYL